MKQENSTSMGLLVSFPDESETFVLGFEAGQVWEKLQAGDLVESVVHTKNTEVITRMARHFKLNAVFAGTQTDGWSVATFSRSSPRLTLVPTAGMGGPTK